MKKDNNTIEACKAHLDKLAEAHFDAGKACDIPNSTQALYMATYQILSAISSRGTEAEIRAISDFFASVNAQQMVLEQALNAITEPPRKQAPNKYGAD